MTWKRPITGLALVTAGLLLAGATDASAASIFAVVPSADGSVAPVSNNLLNGVASISPTDAWTVGFFTDPSAADHTLAEHWDGARWTRTPSPDGTSGSQFLAVAAVSARDVWAVGLQNSNLTVTSDTTLIEHWNGAAWSIVPSPNASTKGDTLTGVTAVSANDVWAVGYFETDDQGFVLPLLEHWDGTRWSVVTGPDVPASTNFLRAVTAVSAHDVWAVGSALDPVTFENDSLILHWDGTRWTALPSLNLPPGNQLQGVHAISANDVWAVGAGNGAGGNPTSNLAVHWDGTRWNTVTVPNVGPARNFLTSVTALSATDVWAVGGAQAANGFNQTLVEHWNGTAWRVVPSPNRNPQGGNPNTLFGVAAAAPGLVTAVGAWQSFQQGNPGGRALILATPRG